MDFFSKDAMNASFAFALKATTHVEAAVNRVVYPDIQYKSLVPVDTSAHPFAKTVTYYSSDKFGAADWINGNADEIPLVGTELAKHESSVHMLGVGYSWGWEEIGQARMLGYALQAEDAMAARRAVEEMIDRVAMVGAQEKGLGGLINNPNITPVPVNTGGWDTASENEILDDVNSILLKSSKDTLYTGMSNTLLMAHDRLNIMATRRLGDNTTNVLEYLKKYNTYTAMTNNPLRIQAVRGLETAGVGGTSRMIAYRRDPSVLKMHIPMPHRFLPVYQRNVLNFEVPGVARIGGLDIRKPLEVVYGDGI